MLHTLSSWCFARDLGPEKFGWCCVCASATLKQRNWRRLWDQKNNNTIKSRAAAVKRPFTDTEQSPLYCISSVMNKKKMVFACYGVCWHLLVFILVLSVDKYLNVSACIHTWFKKKNGISASLKISKTPNNLQRHRWMKEGATFLHDRSYPTKEKAKIIY